MDTCCRAEGRLGRPCDRPPGHSGLHQAIRGGVLVEEWQEGLPFPPFSNPTTSREAAAAIHPRSESLRETVYLYIRMHKGDGCTAQALQDDLALSGDTVRPRIRELVKAGRVYDSGQRRTLPTGRKAIIWRAR